MVRGKRNSIATVAVVLLVALPGGVAQAQEPAAAEIVAEDMLDDPRALFDAAVGLFLSLEQPEAIPVLSRVVAILGEGLESGSLSSEDEKLLQDTLFYRAEAQFNLGENDAARQDLAAILELAPGYTAERLDVSPKLLDLLEEVRRSMVGRITFDLSPEDVQVLVDGELVPGGRQTLPVLAGRHQVLVQRPGYGEQELEIEVEAGRRAAVEAELERQSAVVFLSTRPAGVEVVWQGSSMGETKPAEVFEGISAPADPEALSAPLPIAGLPAGSQSLELRREGYRPARVSVEVEELTDYYLPPVSLERTRGEVILSGVPAGASIRVEGPEPISTQGAGRVELTLPPGEHRITVSKGTEGLFWQRLTLADRQQTDLQVVLRPSLVLLGVLGGDAAAVRDLQIALVDGFSALESWTVVDRSTEAPEVLAGSGIDTAALRRLAEGGAGAGGPDWPRVQAAVDAQLAGSLYLLAVLSDDLYASHADLWLWPSAPASPRPEVRTVPLREAGHLEPLLQALGRPLRLERFHLGARLVDSPAGRGPVLLTLTDGGAAESAGLRLGDEIVSVDGRAVASAEEVDAALQAGGDVELEVVSGGRSRTVQVTLASGPAVLSLSDPEPLDPAVGAMLSAALGRSDLPAPRWVLQLNRAAILLRGRVWREAVRELRSVEAPAREGLGRGTVDYWLGMALLEADPGAYREAARDLLSAAAAAEGARLHHDGGPLVAPRARIRLQALP